MSTENNSGVEKLVSTESNPGVVSNPGVENNPRVLSYSGVEKLVSAENDPGVQTTKPVEGGDDYENIIANWVERPSSKRSLPSSEEASPLSSSPETSLKLPMSSTLKLEPPAPLQSPTLRRDPCSYPYL